MHLGPLPIYNRASRTESGNNLFYFIVWRCIYKRGPTAPITAAIIEKKIAPQPSASARAKVHRLVAVVVRGPAQARYGYNRARAALRACMHWRSCGYHWRPQSHSASALWARSAWRPG